MLHLIHITYVIFLNKIHQIIVTQNWLHISRLDNCLPLDYFVHKYSFTKENTKAEIYYHT